jgi:pseudaminic acid synthase
MSANHNQSYESALKIIDMAAAAKADAIKIQTYTADTITIDSNKDFFQIKNSNLWKGQTLYQLYQKAYTPWDWQPALKEYAEAKGLIFFSAPFDITAVDFLEKLNVPCYKVASAEIIDVPLLERIGRTKKPVFLSNGMASIKETRLAIKTLKRNGTPKIILLHCVSAYPTPAGQMNLLTIPDLVKRFKLISGLSDHALGISASIAAVALGAKVIEKHLTLSRRAGGPDDAFSLEPQEFSDLVKGIRETEEGLGKPFYGPNLSETESITFRKSLFVVTDIKQGEEFSPDNVRSIRPGHGLAPKHYHHIMGRKAIKDIQRATPLTWDLIKK